MNTDCCWFIEEKDCNWQGCRHQDHEDSEENNPCEGCRDYYTKDDAWADAHASRYEDARY